MRNKHLNVFSALSFLSLTTMTDTQAADLDIANGQTVTVSSPATYTQVLFQGASGTLIINSGIQLIAPINNSTSGVGALVLNSGSSTIGTIGAAAGPILSVTLNGNANFDGSLSAYTFNLGQNTYNGTAGALNLPSGIVINTKVVSNALFGHIAAVGADSIAGASVQVNVDASGVIALTPGAPLFVVSANGTTSGLPVNVTSNNVLYSFSGNNSLGNITITPTLNPIIIPPGGVGSVFTELLSIAANNPGSDIATVMAAISALSTPEAIEAALVQFNPNVDGAIPRASFAGAQQFQNLWSKHMGYGRCIYGTDCDDDLVKKKPCQSKSGECGCYAEVNCNDVPNRFELWVDGFGYFDRQYARHGFGSYQDNIYGGMVGFQGPVNREVSLGIGSGYAQTKVKRSDWKNDGSIQTYDATAYASYDSTHWYLDGAFSFDYDVYRSSRHIDFTGIDRRARSHYHGEQYTALVASGYRWYSKSCYIITPLASLQYSYLNVGRYKEHHAGDLNLHVKAQHYNFLESSLGVEMSHPVQTKKGVFVPEIHAMWLYDFFGDKMDLTAMFSGVASQAGSFSVNGPAWARNSGDVGASVSFVTCRRLAIQFAYNYKFSSSYHANEGLIKITKRF
jgi:uncharacterized protein with beta-barrel porin domain